MSEIFKNIGIINQFLALSGVVIIIYAIFSFFKESKMKSNGIRTNAVVIEIIDRGIEYGKCPVFEYHTLNGEKITKKLKVSSDDYSLKQKVEIIYDKNNPEYFTTASGRGMFTGSAGAFIAGVILIVAALIM